MELPYVSTEYPRIYKLFNSYVIANDSGAIKTNPIKYDTIEEALEVLRKEDESN